MCPEMVMTNMMSEIASLSNRLLTSEMLGKASSHLPNGDRPINGFLVGQDEVERYPPDGEVFDVLREIYPRGGETDDHRRGRLVGVVQVTPLIGKPVAEAVGLPLYQAGTNGVLWL